jgi:hypothetical protein
MHQGEEPEEAKLTPLIPPDAFLNVFEAGDPGTVKHEVMEVQQRHQGILKQWERTIPIKRTEETGKTIWRDKKG